MTFIGTHDLTSYFPASRRRARVAVQCGGAYGGLHMNDEIRQRVTELHDHLDGSDADGAAELKEAVAAYDGGGDQSDFIERLRDGALRFESSHPEISAVVARVIDSLTAAGI